MNEQKVMFDGEMWEVGELFGILRDGGWSEDKILRSFEFKLGVGQWEKSDEQLG